MNMTKARAYSNPVPGMIFIHNAMAYKVVRWDNKTSLWECMACGFSGGEPNYYCDVMVRKCAGMRVSS